MKQTQTLMTDYLRPKRKRLITDFFKPIKTSRLAKTPSKNRSSPLNRQTDYKQASEYLSQHRKHYDKAKTHLGYFYGASNDYSEFCVYTTRNMCRCDGNREIFVGAGTKIANATIDSDSGLEHIYVEAAFRRQGIGKQLIRFINKCAPQLHIFAGTEHNSRYRLTNEGAALIQACERDGILKHEQVNIDQVPPSPSIHR